MLSDEKLKLMFAEAGVKEVIDDAYLERGDFWPQVIAYGRAVAEAAVKDAGGGHSGHPDDIAVDKFAAEMKAKMAKQRAKGYGGWDNELMCPADRLRAMLTDHISKGDPVDVGNFAMMLWNRNENTRPQASAAVPEGYRLEPAGGEIKWNAIL